MNRIEMIKDLLESYTGKADAFGIRSDDRAFAVGEALPSSRVWENNEPTDTFLDGVSVTGFRYAEDAEKALRIQEKVYNYGQPMYLVTGDLTSFGEDEGEYILSNAIVIGIL